MQWHLTSFSLSLLVAALSASVVSIVTWQRRGTPGSRSLALLLLAMAEWTLTEAIEMAVVGLEAKIFWSKVSYLGINSAPIFFLIFALEYSQRECWLSRRNLALLSIIPLLTLTLAITNEHHQLIWNSFTPSPDPGSNVLLYGHGIWFWIAVSFDYLVLLAGTLLLVWAALHARNLYRRQVAAILLGVPLPWIASILYIVEWPPTRGQDWTPILFTFTGLLLNYSISRFQLFDLVPIARDAVLEKMADGMLVLDAQNRIADINRAGQVFLGCTASAIGQPVERVLAAWPELAAHCNDAFQTQAEIRLGETPRRDMDLRISPLRNRQERLTGRLIVLRDVTARQQAEEELRRAKEVAEAASRAKSAFLSHMSHELRTPLNAILGFSQLLARAPNLTTEQRDDMLTIVRSGEHLLGLINDVLDMAKIESGRATLQEQSFDLEILLTDLQRMFQRRAIDKGLQLRIEQEPGIPQTICADEGKLRQVLINLLGNAIKFTSSGEVTLWVGKDAAGRIPAAGRVSGKHQQASASLHFAVRDTGIGITADELADLFSPFVQAGGGRRGAEGSGLGLAISREYVRLMGGDLNANSTPGLGSVFQFTIPVGLVASAETGILTPVPTLLESLLPQTNRSAGPASSENNGYLDLSTLPDAYLVELRQAALLGSIEGLATAIGHIRQLDLAAATRLQILADNFEHEAMLRLLSAPTALVTEPLLNDAGR